jgi:hypothetical protein
MARGSCMSSWMTVVIRFPSRSDIAMELVPVSVLEIDFNNLNNRSSLELCIAR